ncbi:PepSY domain-containing protein [Nocardioides sp. SR21]|uniref:PepSY domain-containing protein n=1 Tax=Nocardioides sp. SR21 TaxID=2919501 RepID=UPI001FAA44B1|nr:PepSY domain-containing protein [Nocardioides sp. SR21]
MNLSKLRRKRIIIPAVATIAVLGAGATVWSATADDSVGGSERDRVAAAAVEIAGGGTADEVETSDDPGVAYEVEVRADDGTEIDVALDGDLNEVSTETDADDNDADDAGDTPDADDRALGSEERTAAEQAALEAVGGGTVLQVEASDDPGEAYEAEVRADDGTEWDVTLDADYGVVSKTADDRTDD